MFLVRGSMSTKIGVAPASQMASAVAKNVFDVVMTSSPGPMPSARNVSRRASVPEFKPTVSFAFMYWASSCSNFTSCGPRT